MKRRMVSAVLSGVFCAVLGGQAIAAEMPHTVLHVITIKWKPEATQEQIDKAVGAVQDLAKEYPGIKRVWLKTIKVQGAGYKNVIAMEFESEDALKKYAGSEAQKKWYAIYQPIREQSTTHDVTN